MSLPDELTSMDATAQAKLVRQGEVTPSELLEAAIERIERVNPQINAVIRPMYDQARETVKSELSGPFAGVPFLLKDLLASYAGVPMSYGTRLLKDFVSDHDSELVSRYKKSGLVICGKTNTPEFGLVPTTEPEVWGPSLNPWNTNHTTGGSSGGSAAAVAAGLVPMAHANDGGGSVRIPASCCGLFGLKPTRGRNPLGPDFGDLMGGLVCEHVVSRSVRDSAAMLDATGYPDVGDPYFAPPKARPYLDEVGADPGSLKIALTTNSALGAPVSDECKDAVHEIAALCADLGHEVEEAEPAVDAELFTNTFITLWVAGLPAQIDIISFLTGNAASPEFFEPLTWMLYEEGKKITTSQLIGAQTMTQSIGRQIGRFFVDYDMTLSPTLASPPVEIGYLMSPDNPKLGWDRVIEFAAITPVANTTGQPAMSVPLTESSDGLPIGIHFMGRFGAEDMLFRLAAQLEQARPWAGRKPSVFA